MSKKKDIKSKVDNKKESYSPRMLSIYRADVVPKMISRFNYKNPMQVPKLLSISLNMGLGDAKTNSKKLESAISEMGLITGQKPFVTKSKSDISNFKIRKGYPVGCKVTLRSSKMYEFFERLVCIALPRSRDFRGLSLKSFDGRGNYTLGITEQIIFPEIDIDKVNKISGMDITFVTSASTDNEAKSLLSLIGLPFKKK